MKKILIITTISFLSFFLWNCTERIDIEVDSSYTRLVVEGYVTTDTAAHWVRLSTSSDYFSNQQAPAVSNATVTIDDGEMVHTLTESISYPGKYYTSPDFYGISGRTYTLAIRDIDLNNDGDKEEYTATSRMNPVNQLDSISLKKFEAFGTQGHEVQIYAWDSPQRDWYAFKVLINGKLVTDTLYELRVQNDDFFNGNYTYGISSQFLSMDKPDEVLGLGDTVTFEINGISEDYYYYVIEAQSQIYPQTPLFSGPPANIRTNLGNGAIGYFAAYSLHRSSTIVTPDLIFDVISK